MLAKFRTFASLYRELGLRWSAFRLTYAIRLRTGLIRWQMPQYRWEDRPLKDWLRAERSEERSSRHVVEAQLPEDVPWNPQTAIAEADRILNGELKYFAYEWIKTGSPPNWYKDYFSHVTLSESEGSLSPQSGILRFAQNDNKKHWSQLSDDGDVVARMAQPDEAISRKHSDIKFVWEPNRFAFVYTLVRAYVANHDEKYAEAFWTLIEDWARHNPPNTGPNWMDGQEIALRLMAWTFGYHAFLNSPTSTAERRENFVLFVAAQVERIYKNIGYAISTRSNHTISEAFGLWMVGLLFPELKDSEKYLSLGEQLLEQEAVNQIFPDGSYAMYSLNYHRFILHIYLYAIQLGELNNVPFSTQLKQSVANSITYLSCLIDPATGEMPVYGSNDGALVLPLNTCAFTDYRPLLQLGWYITKGERLFDSGPWDEDIFWLCGEKFTAKGAKDAKKEERGMTLGDLRVLGGESFSHGDTYLLRHTNSRAILRCTDFTSRPSHADQLHVDLWIHGHNLAIDAGTYLYSGQNPWRNGLAHTSVHNTVVVDNKDQMTMLSRFTWTNWSKGKVLKHEKDIWQGEHDGYKPVSHKRTVMALENDRWLVVDNLIASEPHHYALHWLLTETPFEQMNNSVVLSLDGMKYKVQVGMIKGNGNFSIVRADPNSTRGWRSRYYGHKEPAISILLETDQPQVTFWSFFGFENDVIEIVGKSIKVNSRIVPMVE